MGNKISVTLDVKDNGSRVINSFKLKVDSLDNSFGKAGRGATGLGRSLTSSMAAGVVAGNAVIGVIGGIASAAGRAAGALGGLFSSYADYQTESTFTDGALARATGLSLGAATDVMDAALTKLNEAANKLPGTSADFRTIGMAVVDDIAEVTKGLDGKLDTKKLNERLVNIGSLGGVLAAQGIDANKVGVDFQAAFTRRASELKQLQTFQQGEGKKLLEAWSAEVQKLYSVSFDDATIAQRADALSKVKDKFLTPETINKLGQGIDATMSTFQSAITDTKTGLLGFDKDLDKAMAGKQSVGASYTRLISKIFGNNGLFAAIGNLLGEMGFDDTSVLDVIAAAVGKVGSWVDGITRFVNAIDGQDFRLPDGDFNFARVGQLIAEAVNGLINQFNINVTPVEGAEAGNQIGAKLAEAIYGFVDTFDVEGAMQAMGTIAIAAISTTATAIGGLFAQAVVDLGADFWNNSVREFNVMSNALTDFLNTLSRGLNEGISAAISAFNSINWLPNIPQVGSAAQIAPTPINQGTVTSPVGTAATTTSTSNASPGTSARYQGNIPIGVPSMLQAMLKERSAAPVDSDLAVANTSELILNRRQQAQLNGNISNISQLSNVEPVVNSSQLSGEGGGGGVTVNVGGITVHSYAADARAVANEVLALLNQKFAQHDLTFTTGVVS